MPAPPFIVSIYALGPEAFPRIKHRSASLRLVKIVARHQKTCPVALQYLASPANGQKSACINKADAPALVEWAREHSYS